MFTTSPTAVVPPLVGTLPPACQRDLDAMGEFIASKANPEALAPPVAPSGFREVFLTGATGFVGRFLLRDLLVQDDTRIVHCLVRATDAEHGLQRVRAALRQAGIWNEGFAPRIRVAAGDMAADRLGLPEADFADLCQRIDAVYHVAADVALAAPYAKVREAAIGGLRQVLDLCLSHRFKHLFFTSSLGVFPQYFCDFRNEFEQSRITAQMQPDLNTMKRIFPLGLSGYAWSKLVSEQALLIAQGTGMPLAIFRLSLTGMSTTGIADEKNIDVRIYAAMMDIGTRPRGRIFKWYAETIDGHSKLIADISLNPRRRYTIYHCCNPSLIYDDLVPEDFGVYLREVSYATFKRLCLARGSRSPLHQAWPLIDYFAPYWFSAHEQRSAQPICDRAIREDSPGPVKWPGLLTVLMRTDDWILGHPDEWPYPRTESQLDFDRLLSQGARQAEQQDLASDEVLPAWMQAGLHQLVEALQSPAARLQKSATSSAVLEFSRALQHSACLAGDRTRYPDIALMEIAQPIFIVGINRTGTTLLHRLLSRDPRFRTLQGFELVGSISVGLAQDQIWGAPDDPRFQEFYDWLEATGTGTQFEGLHDLDPNEAEEELMSLRACFHSWEFAVRYHVPAYAQWLAQTDMYQAYCYHRHTLQHFAHVDRVRQVPPAQWLLKLPFHLMELDALIQAYPDALFIQTHRAPNQFMGSWNSLVRRIRALTADPLPSHELGVEQLALMSGMMDRAVDFRLAYPELEHRWLDLSYYDFVREPMAMVKVVYDHFGWNLEPRSAAAMDDWLARQSRQRSGETRHQYDLADYGLTRDKVDKAFAGYREFVADRRIHPSRM